MADDGITFAAVPPAIVRPLRQRVLRPHQTLAEQVYPGDAVPGALHVAAYARATAEPVGVASIAPEPYPKAAGTAGDWRIRGMATAPEARGRHVGAQLLTALLDHARAQPTATRVWCNARADVIGFYAREGFTVDGARFELPGIGSHVLMALPLAR
jgi:predicted GNAT family N-acyltransferase